LSLKSPICKNFLEPSEIVENYPTNFNTIVNSNIIINKLYLELSIPSILTSGNPSYSNNQSKGSSESKANFSSKHSFTKEAKFDFNNNGYLNNISSFSKISPFKADQGMKPYFYVKNPVDKKQYNSNGAKATSNLKNNEISIYDIINNKEGGFKRNATANLGKKKEVERNFGNERLNGFIRKVVNPETYQKEKSSITNSKGTNRPNYLNIFLNYHENLSNFHIFLRSVTPYIDVKKKNCLDLITIQDYFFTAFEKLSVFGLETPILHDSMILS
jgi:hypothetical protein